jgi:hypothetical protein
MRTTLLALSILTMLAATAGDAVAQTPAFGRLYYEGAIVRTVVPPAAMPNRGRDDLYAIDGGAAGQLAVIAVAPGDREYHGVQWAFHGVVWNVTPYLLTSADAVLAAAASGDVTITRVPDNDFKCPVQP